MKIIISPAKNMVSDPNALPPRRLPIFLPQAEELLQRMRSMDGAQLQALWRCNDAIARLNLDRLRRMDLTRDLTPAIFSYQGIQYRYMAPRVFTSSQLSYVEEHLYLLSGFYGLLRPFDAVTPYRLEMQAKLSVGQAKDLYAFWGDKLSRQVCAQTDWILNLASREYSRTISAHLPQCVRFLTCSFGAWHNGKVVEKGTLCKMARGEMVRFLAEQQITTPEGVKSFCRLGYQFSPDHSTPDHVVFLQQTAAGCPPAPSCNML